VTHLGMKGTSVQGLDAPGMGWEFQGWAGSCRDGQLCKGQAVMQGSGSCARGRCATSGQLCKGWVVMQRLGVQGWTCQGRAVMQRLNVPGVGSRARFRQTCEG